MLNKVFVFIFISFFSISCASNNKWQKDLSQLDEDFSGNLGVYIKDLGSGKEISYNADRLWYLASTVKIPIAIAVLQKVEAGEISLENELTLNKSDLVDGAGALVWREPGSKYTVRELLIRMLKDSDSVAADMLVRLLGENEFNQHLQEYILGDGIKHITTILQVRYDAYSEIHERASTLSNMDIIRLKGVTPLQERLNELVRLMGVEKKDLQTESIRKAFEKYYERNLNSGELTAMGEILEKFYNGEYLNETHTEFLIETMREITTGDHRIKAGLPPQVEFAQKTGTQISRACNVGIIYPSNGQLPIIVAAATEKYGGLSEAETILKEIGKLISEKMID